MAKLAPLIIKAKWKTSLDSVEEHFGTITLDGDFHLELPMLAASDAIPPQTNVLWGLTDRLRRCTAQTLPFRQSDTSYRQASNQIDRMFSARSALRYLFVGEQYLRDPLGELVAEIAFTPQPNKDLHAQRAYQFIEPNKDISDIKFAPACAQDRKAFASAHIAYFERAEETLFEVAIGNPATTVTAWFGRRSIPPSESDRETISFNLRFPAPRTAEAALGETFKLCAFLSLISHQCVYPSNFHVRATGEEAPFDLHIRQVQRGSQRERTWVGHTLVLPDEHPVKFSEALRNWYGSNDKLLRSRYLYRHSIEEPNVFSTDRFLCIFQALEGIVRLSGGAFLSEGDLARVEAAIRSALPGHAQLDAIVRKIRSNNAESPGPLLKRELPKLFEQSHISAKFNI